jgi:Putative  PD-(D/E)XK family member, (DUF4420)
MELRIDGGHEAVSLRCPVKEPVDLGAFGAPEELMLRRLEQDPGPGPERLEISVSDIELLPYFLGFVETVVDAVQLHEAEVPDAIQTSMRLFRRLLRDVKLASREKIVGLLGELWVLNRLIDVQGAQALDAWTGPRGEAHDFRTGDAELEVKTTTKQRRVHVIHGLDQLEPSVGADLYLVSIQLAAGGGAADAFTLSEWLVATRERLDGTGRVEAFDQILLDHYGLAREDAGRYRDSYRLRSDPVLIEIHDGVPHLTHTDLEMVSRPEMQRVGEVDYGLDVEGLGVADGSPEFEVILPKRIAE